MTDTRSDMSFLKTLARLMQRAARERRILPTAMQDEQQEGHLAESYLISTPPELFAAQRRTML